MASNSISLPKRTVSDTNIVINGTANRVSVSRVGDTFTLTTPQAIAPASSPTFVGLILTGNLGAVNATLSGDVGAVNATLSGDIGAVNGTFSGDVGAVNLTASAAISGETLILTTPGTGTGTSIVRDASGNLVELTSTRDFKTNIRDINTVIDINKIYNVQSVAFNYIGSTIDSFGFIAEDLELIEPKLVIYKDGKPHAIQYDNFVPVLLEMLKIHDDKISSILNNSKEEKEDNSELILEKIAYLISSNKDLKNELLENSSKIHILETDIKHHKHESIIVEKANDNYIYKTDKKIFVFMFIIFIISLLGLFL